MESKNTIHPSGLNILQNSDGSFVLEWHKEDLRWNWLNDLTDEEIKVIIEEMVQDPTVIEELFNGIKGMGGNE